MLAGPAHSRLLSSRQHSSTCQPPIHAAPAQFLPPQQKPLCQLPAASHVAQSNLYSPAIASRLDSSSSSARRQSHAQASSSGKSGSSQTTSQPSTDALELATFLRLFKAKQREGASQGPGRVYLVGTGPGDPGLLTLRAAQLMQTADVVLYDRLVSDDILRLVGPSARMVYVGKAAGFHSRSQDEIHELLLAFASAGARVVRLKGGDPYVFGRGGEEVSYLAARGIQVHCVPGITAASGICAELGIPMTHRGHATSVRFLTGHAKEGGEAALDASVAAASDPHTTLVVYMGLGNLPHLTTQLFASGTAQDLPAVAVERGTTSDRRVVYGPLSELSHRAGPAGAGLASPTLVVMGQVVGLCPGWAAWNAAGRPLEWSAASEYPELELGAEGMAALFGSSEASEGQQLLDAAAQREAGNRRKAFDRGVPIAV